jgi:hypothetical protein
MHKRPKAARNMKHSAVRRATLLTVCLCLAKGPAPVKADDATRIAGRYFLSSGDTREVAFSQSFKGTNMETTLVMRDVVSGSVMTVAEQMDFTWGHQKSTFTDGKTSLTVWAGLHFGSKDKLPYPFEVRIGESIYRALIPVTNSTNAEQRRIQAAVSKLPSSFLNGLRKLEALLTERVSTPSLAVISELFDASEPVPQVVSKVPLKPSEIENLIAAAAAR